MNSLYRLASVGSSDLNINQIRQSVQSIDLDAVISLGISLAIAGFIFFIVLKLFHAFFAMIVLAIVIPILFTIFFGNGSNLVHDISSYLTPDVGQQVEQSYDYFKKKDFEDQIIDYQKISNKVSSVATEKFSYVIPKTSEPATSAE